MGATLRATVLLVLLLSILGCGSVSGAPSPAAGGAPEGSAPFASGEEAPACAGVIAGGTCLTTTVAPFPGGVCRVLETAVDLRTGEVLFMRERGPAPCPTPAVTGGPVAPGQARAGTVETPRLCAALTVVRSGDGAPVEGIACVWADLRAVVSLPAVVLAISQGPSGLVVLLDRLPAPQATVEGDGTRRLTLRLEPAGPVTVAVAGRPPVRLPLSRPVVIPRPDGSVVVRAPYRLRVRVEAPDGTVREAVEDGRAIAGRLPDLLVDDCAGDMTCLLAPAVLIRPLLGPGEGRFVPATAVPSRP